MSWRSTKYPEKSATCIRCPPAVFSNREGHDLVRRNAQDEDVAKLPYTEEESVRAGAAWSANRSAVFLDLAVKMEGAARIAAVISIHQATGSNRLSKFKAINMDMTPTGPAITTNRDLDQAPRPRWASHHFETYEGDHNGKVPERFDTVLPFFAQNLE